MTTIRKTYGLANLPNCSHAIVEHIGPYWMKFPKIFPVYFYNFPADMVIQARVDGKEPDTLVINIFQQETEKEINAVLNTAGVVEGIMQKAPAKDVDFLYDLRKGYVLDTNRFYYANPPIEKCIFLMWSYKTGRFYLSSNSISQALFVTANYIAMELSYSATQTAFGKELALSLIPSSQGVVPTYVELQQLGQVDLPRGIGEDDAISVHSPDSLKALKTLSEKIKKKVKLDPVVPELDLLTIVKTGTGIPKGCVENNIKTGGIKLPIKINTMMDRIEEAFLLNGELWIKPTSNYDKDLYIAVPNIFKVKTTHYIGE